MSMDGKAPDPASPAARGGTAEREELELVRRCCAGDHQAWRTLYDRHFRAVLRFVGALGVPPSEREDAVQDIFVSLYRALPGFRGEARFSTWVYRIAARHAIYLGRRRRARQLLSTLVLREPAAAPAFAPPAEAIERREEIALLDRLLARLSVKKRTALVLFEIEGLAVEEIAEVAGCPVNTVWSRLHHARAELMRLAQRAERGALRASGQPRADGAESPARPLAKRGRA
jgi:RNA polymerase sigma-70 factor (ECF subfamily)